MLSETNFKKCDKRNSAFEFLSIILPIMRELGNPIGFDHIFPKSVPFSSYSFIFQQVNFCDFKI